MVRKTKTRLRKIFTPANTMRLVKYGAWAFAAGVVLLALLFVIYSRNLPDINNFDARVVEQSTRILDRNGVVLYDIHNEVKRKVISFDQMPDSIKQASVAIEDKDFYKHKGISITGILRAVFKDIFYGKRIGGSSISQQLVKNSLLTNEKTLPRKIKEIILT
ncbi:MAG TPA: transglycosylase domain-containing protein, partial [Flavobacterium sp.]|nr:transglycosylase domain-containing protein [Flavobacterium sp.]